MDMKNVWKPAIMSLFMLFSTIVIIHCMDNVSGITRYVGGGGSPNYPDISTAIANSNSGDIIFVDAGTYNENIIIDVEIYLIGVNGTPIIQAANEMNPVIEVTVSPYNNPVFVENFAITGGSYGIYSDSVLGNQNDGIIFYQCLIFNNNIGVTIIDGDYFVFDDCWIYSNTQYGIEISGSHNTITYSNVCDNGWDGIYSTFLTQSEISYCNVYNNGFKGINLQNANYNDIWTDNIYDNNGEGVHLEGNNNDINGYQSSSIYDNYKDGSSGETYDILICGDSNTLRNYTIYQGPTQDFQNRYGIYSSGPGNIYGNKMIDCIIYGYDNSGCIGIGMNNEDEVLGTLTRVYGNTIGLTTASDTIVDCQNLLYSSNSENFKDNNINIKIINSFTNIHHTFIKNTNTPSTEIGIKFDTELKSVIVQHCKVQNMNVGVDIYQSNPEDEEYPSDTYYNIIDDCTFVNCGKGVKIDQGNYDQIQESVISECDIGVSIADSTYINIDGTTFNDNYGDPQEITAGIYISGGSYNIISNCTMTTHYKGIWLCDETSYNEIIDTEIKDSGSNVISEGEWGDDDVEIGVYIENSDNNEITRASFDYLGYCIGIVSSTDIDIQGNSSDKDTISNTEFYVLYAINDDTNISAGIIEHYGKLGTTFPVYLRGYSNDEGMKTYFIQADLIGTWDPDPYPYTLYYVWTTWA